MHCGNVLIKIGKHFFHGKKAERLKNREEGPLDFLDEGTRNRVAKVW
jgi:hypothetical protein